MSVESDDFTPYLRLEHGTLTIEEDSGRGAHFTFTSRWTGELFLTVSTTDTDDEKKVTGKYTLKVGREQTYRFFGMGGMGGMGGVGGVAADESGGNEVKATPVNDKDVQALLDVSGDVRARAFTNLAGSLPNNLPPPYPQLIARYLLLGEWVDREEDNVKPHLKKVARCRPLLQALDDIIANEPKATQDRTETVLEGLFGEQQHFAKGDWPTKAHKVLVRRMLELAEKKHKSAVAGGDADKAAAFLRDLYKEQGLAFGMDSAALEGETQLTEVLESLIKHVAARANEDYAKQIDRRLRATAVVAENDLEHAVLLQRVWVEVLVHDLQGEAPEAAKKKTRQILDDLETKDRQASGLLDQLRLGEEMALRVWEIALDPKAK